MSATPPLESLLAHTEPGRSGGGLLTAAAWSTAAMLPGVLAFQPAFGGLSGAIPGLAGVVVGVGIGVLAVRLRLSLLPTLLALIAAYFAFGGAVALRQTTVVGFVPSPDTLGRLLAGLVRSWRDLLTVTTPAGDFLGPAVVPWLAGLVLGCVAATVAVRTRRGPMVLFAPVAWLVLGIAFGVRAAPLAAVVGALQAVVGVAWLTYRLSADVREASEDLLVNPRSRPVATLRRAGAAVAVLILAAVGSGYAVAATSREADRHVLREYVAPPFDLVDYPTPLATFRLYETDLADEVLMTVTGLPADARLRVATMDTYDGTVYNVSRVTADYLRVGRRFDAPRGDGVATVLGITVGAYQGVWVPLAGAVHGIVFGQPADQARAVRQADGLYLNRATNSALTTEAIGQGDRITVETLVADQPTSTDGERLRALPAGRLNLPRARGVPEAVGSFAADAVAGADTPFTQLAAIEALLRQGYYSDGADGLSRSGHTNERLASMFTTEALIGDDEQYATAMALMANQLGIPTRVVMGFYPTGDQKAGQAGVGLEWKVTGSDAHVWVESYLDGAGWVVFDPTPDRDRTPKTEVPRPRPQPRPMVEPPPNPPDQPTDPPRLETDQTLQDEDGESVFGAWLGYLLIAVSMLGSAALLAAPFVVILVMKGRRRGARRTDGVVRARFAGAWDEVVDQALDLGVRQSASLTRREGAAAIAVAFAGTDLIGLAERLDHGTFAPREPLPEEAETAWQDVEVRCRAMARSVPWHRRLRARFSLGSLIHRRTRNGWPVRPTWARNLVSGATRLLRTPKGRGNP